MADDEAKILKRKEPPHHSGVSVLGPSHPLEGRVVRQERKLTAEKMITELQDCPFYGQSLLLDCRVVLLSASNPGQSLPSSTATGRSRTMPTSMGQDPVAAETVTRRVGTCCVSPCTQVIGSRVLVS